VGKSTPFDAFGLLADCLKFGVEEACEANGGRGFRISKKLWRDSFQQTHDMVPL